MLRFKSERFFFRSDIDIVVFGKWDTLPMEKLKEELIKKGVAEVDSVKVLDRAAVSCICKTFQPALHCRQ